MKRIVIAGCGYVGRATAKLFLDAGWHVTGWTFSEQSARELADELSEVRAVDLTDAESVTRAAAEADAVIHCASSGGGGVDAYRAIYLNGARHLLAAFPQSRMLFTSSTSVYAQTDGGWVTEQSAAEPERETGKVLRETEELVLRSEGTVARLAGIYGPGRSALLRKFLAGEAVIDPGAERFINQVHRDDIASALLLLVSRNRATSGSDPQIYNVADNHPTTQHECYRWLAEHFQKPMPLVAETPSARKRGNSNKRVSSEKLQALGWSPRYPTFEHAMRESILPAAGL